MTLFIMVWKVINTLIISIWNVDNREFVQSCPALVWKVPKYISTFIASSQTEKIVLNFLDFNSNQKHSILVIQCVTSGRSPNQPIRTLQITHDSDKHLFKFELNVDIKRLSE